MRQYVTILSLAALLSCSNNNINSTKMADAIAEENDIISEMEEIPMPSATEEMIIGEDNANIDNKSSTSGKMSVANSDSHNITIETKKLIRHGNITLEVEDRKQTEQELINWCEKSGGYIVTQNQYEWSWFIEMKIPNEKFEQMMNDCEKIGKVKSRGISTEDVTNKYYDLQQRIETKEVLVERLNSYLKEAKNVEELISVEKQLNSTISELESMKGNMKRLNNQTSYCTLNVTLHEPNTTIEQSFGDKVSATFDSFGDVLGTIALILINIVIFGTPIILILALLYWLCFGKLGLIKRLFKRLK